MIIQGNPSPEDRNLYEEWLKNNHFKYRNRWSARRKGQLLADAGRSNELKKRVGDTEGVVMISIG